MIFYTDRFIPKGSAGCMRVFFIPLIFIRPQYKDDMGLLAHEKKHAEQAWRHILPPIYAIRYLLSESYRLESEVECYKVQLGFNPYNLLKFAEFIANDYNIDISVADAANLLKD